MLNPLLALQVLVARIGVHVSTLLFGVDVGNGDHDTGLFHSAKFVVEGRAETLHAGGEVHIGVDEGRDVLAQSPHLAGAPE